MQTKSGHLLQIRNALQERKVRISVGIDEDTWIGIHYLQNELDNDDLDNFNETDIALDRSFNNSAEDLPILGHMDKSNDGVWRYVLDLQKIDEANSYLQERGLPESLSEQECIYITPEGEFSNAMCNEKLQFVCMRDSWTQVVVDSNPLSGAQMSSIASLAV